MTPDLNNINDLLEAFKGAFGSFESGGKLAGLGALLMLAIRFLRSDMAQKLLPEKLKWDNLPWYAKWGLPFILAGLATFLTALSAGTTAITAIVSAIAAGASAIGLHQLTKTAGSLTTTDQPSALRTALAPLLPIDKSKLPDFTLPPAADVPSDPKGE